MQLLLLLLLLAPAVGLAGQRWDLLVQGAVDTELQPLLKALEARHEVRKGPWTFWTGRIGRTRVVISRTDMGPINAVGATLTAISEFHPKAIVNQGTAGAHNPDLHLWDIVIGEKTVDYSGYRSTHADEGGGIQVSRWSPMAHQVRDQQGVLHTESSFSGDRKLVDSFGREKNPRGRVVTGVVGSAFQFNREVDYLREMRRLFSTDSEDMESAYVAGIARMWGVPFVAVRIISDSEWTHPRFERISGEYCAEFVLNWIRGGARP